MDRVYTITVRKRGSKEIEDRLDIDVNKPNDLIQAVDSFETFVNDDFARAEDEE